MKIFINTTSWAIVKQENETPILAGNNYVDQLKVYYDSNPSTQYFYPLLNILKPNDRKVGLISFDATSVEEPNPSTYTDDDNNTWYMFKFTLSSDNHQIDVSGKYQFTITTNYYNSTNGAILKQRNVNAILSVVNAVTNDDNSVLILGDDPSQVVAELYSLCQSLQTGVASLQISVSALQSGKADLNNPSQDIVAGNITAENIQAVVIGDKNSNAQIILDSVYDGISFKPKGSSKYITIGDGKISGVDTVSGANDATNKQYVDTKDALKADLNNSRQIITANKVQVNSVIDGTDTSEIEMTLGAINFYAKNWDNHSQYRQFIFGYDTGLQIDEPTKSYNPTTKNYVDTKDALKLDKANVYNGLDKTAGGYALDARQGKALKDSLDTLYNYVGYATENDDDTTINKLREIFQFLAGEADDATLLSLLAGKQAKIDSDNKLDADLVDDTTSANKFVSQQEKNQITANKNAIEEIEEAIPSKTSDLTNDSDFVDETTCKNYTNNIYSLATNNIAGKDTSTNILAKSSNTGIWIGTDTGHWYYWNGTQYADGGVYQASVYNDTIKRVALPLFNINSDDVTENKYINYQWGVEGNLTGVKYVTFIVKGIEKIYYSATNNSPDNRGLAFYNESGTFISGSGVQMIGTVQEISVPSNAYYCKATVYNISQVALKLSIFDVLNKIKDINIYKNDSVITTSDKYINYQWGIESSLSGAKFVTLNVFGAKKVIYKSINNSPDNRGLAFYNQNGNFISGSGVQMGTTAQTVNVPSNAYYCKATVINIDEVIIDTDVNALIKTISENNLATKTKSLNILHAFSNIYCIGDSLTYGQVYTSANTSRQAYVNYPNALARITGANVNYDATSGYTAIWWWQAYNNNIIQRDNQLAIVYLGSNSGLTDTIATDCVGDDYTQWADTNTGDYAKIIAKCQSVGMKVLLVKIPNNDTTTNSVIEKMAIKFNCVAIEPISLSDDKYHYYPDGTGANSYHYNDLGYSAWAEQLVYNVGLLSNNEMKKIIPN